MPLVSSRIVLAVGLIIAVASARLLPHPPNVTPIAALALLGGATLRAPWSLALPLAAMFASDLLIGFDALPITASVYGSFIITVAFGRFLRRPSPWRILSVSLMSSVLFYLVTNAAVWWFSALYPKTIDGLLLSYFFALPFFRHTVFGDMVYSYALFSALHVAPVLVSAVLRFGRRGAKAPSPDLHTSS